MNNDRKQENMDGFQVLLHKHLDGELNEAEYRRLGEMLKERPERARELAFMARLEVAQRQLARSGGSVQAPANAGACAVVHYPRVWMAAAAAVMLLAVAWAVTSGTTTDESTGQRSPARGPAETAAATPAPPKPEPMPPVSPKPPRRPEPVRRDLASANGDANAAAATPAPPKPEPMPPVSPKPPRRPEPVRRDLASANGDANAAAATPAPPKPEPMPPVSPKPVRRPERPRRELADAGSGTSGAVAHSGPGVRVTSIEGRAVAQGRNGARRRLREKDEVAMGETILTGRGSKMELRFADGTVLVLGPRARARLDEFAYAPGDPGSKCTVSISRGAFKLVSGLIAGIAPDRIKLKTPTATIGIRGTTCVGTTDERTTIAIYAEGKAISVSNALGETILTGKPGMGCETLAGRAPGRARLYKLAQVRRIMRLVTLQAARNAARNAANAAAGAVHVPVVRH